MQRYFRKYGVEGYVLKVDIHDYFGTTSHSVAKNAVSKRVSDEWAKQMVFTIIDSFTNIAEDVGMGLGSQITQLVQLAVLDDLDHKIKEQLRIKYYIRYMDDFVLIHNDRSYLMRCLNIIEGDLNALGLTINKSKTGIQPLKHGIKFLGFRFMLSDTGAVVKTLLTGKASKERKKLKKQSELLDSRQLQDCYMSWRSFVSKGNTYGILSDMDDYFERLKDE